MKAFIISVAISLVFNLLPNLSFIEHFSLFYMQVMILFVIEEVHIRWNERFHYWDEHVSIEDVERNRLIRAINHCQQLQSYITELGFILVTEDITVKSDMCPQHLLRMFQSSWNSNKHTEVGISWLIARGYTADKLDELEEDMPRILAYLRNVQTIKAIDAL